MERVELDEVAGPFERVPSRQADGARAAAQAPPDRGSRARLLGERAPAASEDSRGRGESLHEDRPGPDDYCPTLHLAAAKPVEALRVVAFFALHTCSRLSMAMQRAHGECRSAGWRMDRPVVATGRGVRANVT